ncbi:MAG: universal stress protein [Desulfurococcales archaeon]|nr:universal stress protein [Desulfurococcales archaeon]
MSGKSFTTPTYEVSYLFRKILVPIDGSENSLRALDIAVDFAVRYGSYIVVYYATYRGQDDSSEVLGKAKKRIGDLDIRVTFKHEELDPREKATATAIVEEATNGGYDLVIIGARGRSVSEDVTIGSKALSLIANSVVSVFVIR